MAIPGILDNIRSPVDPMGLRKLLGYLDRAIPEVSGTNSNPRDLGNLENKGNHKN